MDKKKLIENAKKIIEKGGDCLGCVCDGFVCDECPRDHKDNCYDEAEVVAYLTNWLAENDPAPIDICNNCGGSGRIYAGVEDGEGRACFKCGGGGNALPEQPTPIDLGNCRKCDAPLTKAGDCSSKKCRLYAKPAPIDPIEFLKHHYDGRYFIHCWEEMLQDKINELIAAVNAMMRG